MNALAAICLLALMAVLLLGTFLITRAIYKKQIKDAWNKADALQGHVNDRNEAITKRIGEQARFQQEYDELKKQHQEVQDKCTELQKVDEEGQKTDEENAQAFENLQKLHEEAEATNGILLQYISGEITKEAALAQIAEIEKTSIANNVEEQPVEEQKD